MDLSKYYENICKEPILTKSEEKRLVTIYKNMELPEEERHIARDQLLKANLRFVFKQAKSFSRNDPGIFPELISAGNEGLMVGLDKFDPSKGTRLLSYAGWWINQRILKEMSLMRLVRLPIWKQQLSTKIAKFKQGRENVPFKDIVAKFPDIPEKDLRELSDTRYLTYYIDDLSEENFEIDPIGTEVDRNLDNKKIHDIVQSLESPYREILIYTFGFEDDNEIPLHHIAKKLILTKDQIKELKKEALELVKEKMNFGNRTSTD